MGSLLPQQLEAIRSAIALCYQTAERPLQPETVGVVPLAALLCAWPLLFEEIPNLTRRRAAEYLSQRSGHMISLETDADHPLAGFLYAYPYFGEVWGCILVEKNDRVERRRFSAAHELGHYLLHFMPRIKSKIEQGEYLYLDESLLLPAETGAQLPHDSLVFARPSTATPVPERDTLQMEIEANRFAAELLIPDAACRGMVARTPARVTPRRLATDFLVSPAAMEYRLRTLGLLAPSEAERVR